MRGPGHGFTGEPFSPFRFDHGEEGIQQVFDHREFRDGLLHFVKHHLAEGSHPGEGGIMFQRHVGMVVVVVVELKNSFGDEFAFKVNHPDVTQTFTDHGFNQVGFTLRDEADKGGRQEFRPEVDYMFNLAALAYHQLFVIVNMKPVVFGGMFLYILTTEP